VLYEIYYEFSPQATQHQQSQKNALMYVGFQPEGLFHEVALQYQNGLHKFSPFSLLLMVEIYTLELYPLGKAYFGQKSEKLLLFLIACQYWL